jgi:hypothetical protein
MGFRIVTKWEEKGNPTTFKTVTIKQNSNRVKRNDKNKRDCQ